jgi:glycosyltransferase involved in cell wall biosynthesis
MNVLHFINNLEREGAQVVVSNLVGSHGSGASYCVCARQPGGPLAAELREQGITVLEPSKYYGFRSILRSFVFLKQCCIDNRIDIIHAHMADAACLGWLVARHLKMPLIISHHGHDILLKCNLVCRAVYFALLSFAVRYAATNIAVSESVAERVRKLLRLEKNRVLTIANGVRIPEDSLLEKYRLGNAERPASLVLVTVGRLVPLKGQDQIIRAVAQLSGYFAEIQLYIVGSGDREQALSQLAESEQVSGHIVFTGAVANVTEYLAKADIYVSGSHSEGMPVSILEAMACRLAVVASDIPGNRSVVTTGETGLLFELNNIDDLVEKIVKVARNPDLARDLAGRARRLIEQDYSAAAAEQQHACVYRRVLGRTETGFQQEQ